MEIAKKMAIHKSCMYFVDIIFIKEKPNEKRSLDEQKKI